MIIAAALLGLLGQGALCPASIVQAAGLTGCVGQSHGSEVGAGQQGMGACGCKVCGWRALDLVTCHEGRRRKECSQLALVGISPVELRQGLESWEKCPSMCWGAKSDAARWSKQCGMCLRAELPMMGLEQLVCP